MGDLFIFLLSPLSAFAFHPLRIMCVCVIMLLPCLFTRHKRSAKLAMAIATLPWLLFLYTEATTPTTSNIRADLAILGPIYLLSFIAWIAVFVAGVLHRSPQYKH